MTKNKIASSAFSPEIPFSYKVRVEIHSRLFVVEIQFEGNHLAEFEDIHLGQAIIRQIFVENIETSIIFCLNEFLHHMHNNNVFFIKIPLFFHLCGSRIVEMKVGHFCYRDMQFQIFLT